MPSTARNTSGSTGGLRPNSFAEHGGGALAGIFLDELFDEEEGLASRLPGLTGESVG